MNLCRYLYSLLYMNTNYISISLISELYNFFYKVQLKKVKKLPKVGVGENSRIQRTIGGIFFLTFLYLAVYLFPQYYILLFICSYFLLFWGLFAQTPREGKKMSKKWASLYIEWSIHVLCMFLLTLKKSFNNQSPELKLWWTNGKSLIL